MKIAGWASKPHTFQGALLIEAIDKAAAMLCGETYHIPERRFTDRLLDRWADLGGSLPAIVRSVKSDPMNARFPC